MSVRYFLILMVVATVLVTGCGSGGQIQYSSPQDAFEQGMEMYERGRYDRAIRYFRAVFEYGRMTDVAPDAQLYLARSYRDNHELLVAATEYERFMQLYPNDPRVEEAEYERAMAFYQRSPSYEYDQTYTRRALQAFQLFLSRYPGSERAPEVADRIDELRNRLARKHYHTGELYERRELFHAAALSFDRVFEEYPDSELADDALLAAMRNYIAYSEQSVRARQPERLQLAIDRYERLIQLFPDSPLLKEAEQYYDQAVERREQLAAGS